MRTISIFVYLLYITNVYAQQSINGVWQIMSYQIIAYPAIPDTEIKNWIGRKVEFTSEQQAILRYANNIETCSKFNQQVTIQNSEAYFLMKTVAIMLPKEALMKTVMPDVFISVSLE